MRLIKENIELIVDSKEKADRLLYEGWSVLEEEETKKPVRKQKKDVIK